MVTIASCITAVFAGLVLGGVIGGARESASSETSGPPEEGRKTATRPILPLDSAPGPQTEARATKVSQDPQDRPGSSARARAERILRAHSALQQLPYRRPGLSISVIGADHGRALIRVEAPTVAAARRRWALFLRRADDDGSAYLTRFLPRSRSIPGAVGGTRARGDHGPDPRRGSRGVE